MAAVTICSDFGAQENKVSHCFHCFPIYLPWINGTRCHDLHFSMWSFKSAFSLFSFTFIKWLFVVKKENFIALPGKGRHIGLLSQKTVCLNPKKSDECFYNRKSKVRVSDKIGVWGISGCWLLILMSFSGPFNLASGAFLAASPLISNCSIPPFGTQERS